MGQFKSRKVKELTHITREAGDSSQQTFSCLFKEKVLDFSCMDSDIIVRIFLHHQGVESKTCDVVTFNLGLMTMTCV